MNSNSSPNLPAALLIRTQRETLPAVPEETLPVPTLGTQLERLLVNDWYKGVKPEARMLAIQKRDWVRAVDALLELINSAGRQIHTQATAVAQASDPKRFPLLLTAGQHGTNAMSVTNYRQWRGQLVKAGDGRAPKWDAVDALVKQSGLARGRPLKAEQYWDFTQDVLRLWLVPRKPKLPG
jgi:hypothetical protein